MYLLYSISSSHSFCDGDEAKKAREYSALCPSPDGRVERVKYKNNIHPPPGAVQMTGGVYYHTSYVDKKLSDTTNRCQAG